MRMVLASVMVALAATGQTLGVEEVRLASGDRLVGEVIERTDEVIVLEHDVLGRLEIPRSKLAADELLEAAVDDATAPAMLQDAAPAAEKEWAFSVTAGLAASFGNTDEQSGNAAFTAVRERSDTRLSFDMQYFYSASNGDRTDNKFTTGLRNDWLMPESPWFIFAQGRYDNDEFQSWDYRAGAHGGVGYVFVEEPDVHFSGRLGAGGTKEWGSADEDFKPELLVGADFRWQISEKQNFNASTTFFPDLDDTGEFRNLSSASWSILMDEELNMSFNVGLSYEHQSIVDPGTDRNDFRITAGLKFDW